MPALPVWLLWVLGVAALALVAVVTYFLTSSSAKGRAAAFKEKVLRMVTILKERVERLEAAREAAAAARQDADRRATEAERRSAEAGEDAARLREEASAERRRADQAERLVQELEERLRGVRDAQALWSGEAPGASDLVGIAGTGVSVASVLALQTIVGKSAWLSTHKMRPEAALAELDELIRGAEHEGRVEESAIAAALGRRSDTRTASGA